MGHKDRFHFCPILVGLSKDFQHDLVSRGGDLWPLAHTAWLLGDSTETRAPGSDLHVMRDLRPQQWRSLALLGGSIFLGVLEKRDLSRKLGHIQTSGSCFVLWLESWSVT